MGRPKTFGGIQNLLINIIFRNFLDTFIQHFYMFFSLGKAFYFLDCAFNSYPDIQLPMFVTILYTLHVSGTRRDYKHSSGGHNCW